MNKITLLLVASLIASSPSYANDSVTSREHAATRYVKVVPTAQLLDEALYNIAKKLPYSERSAFIDAARASIDVQRLERVTVAAMARTFTVDEIDALTEFYTSPHGASAMKKFGTYMNQIMPVLEMELAVAVKAASK